MSTLTQISNLFNLMVQQPNSGLKFYHFGWRSDINRNIDNNFDQGVETGRLFPSLQMHVPEYVEPADGEKLQFEGFKEKIQITLYFDDLQDYENDGDYNTDNLIEQWQDLKKVADVFIINFNELYSNHYQAGYLEDNIRFIPRSNLHNDRLITWEVNFDLVHFVDCVDVLDKIDPSQFPAEFSDISVIDIENYNPATPPTRCDLILQQLSTDDLLNCILPTYDFSDTATQDATTSQQQTDMTNWLCTPVAVESPSSMVFNGVNKRIRLPNEALYEFETTDSFTFSFFIKLNSSKIHNVLNKWTSAGDDKGIFSLILSNQKLRLNLQATAMRQLYVETVGTIALNTWVHVAQVYQYTAGNPAPSMISQYFDGILQTNTTLVNSLLSTDSINNAAYAWFIGLSNDLTNGLDGKLHEVRFWNTALTQSEVQTDRANILAFNNGTSEVDTPVQDAFNVFRNKTGKGAVLGASDWCFPNAITTPPQRGSQSVLMEFLDKDSDIPL